MDDFSSIDADLKAFSGQKRLAELLYQKNLQTPQGGMVGNIYVGASPWQFLGNLANQYVADEELKDIEKKEINAVKQDRLRDILAMTEANQYMQGAPAVPATPEQYKMLEGQVSPRDDEGNLLPGTQYIPAKEGRAAMEPDQKSAIQRLLMGGKASQAYAMELLKEKPNWDVVTQTIDGQDIKTLFDKSSRTPLKTVMQYGPASPNVSVQTAMDAGIIPRSGMGVNPNKTGSFGQLNFGDPRLTATAAVENPQGLNITSKDSTAHGLFQITKGTFEDTIAKTPELRGVTYEQFQKDPTIQAKVATARHNINDADLAKNGIEADPVTRQARWFTGNAGLAKAVNDPQAQNAPVSAFMTPEQVKANPAEAKKTVAQYRNDVAQKIMQAQGGNDGGQKAQTATKYSLQAPQFDNPKEEREWWSEARKPLTGEPLKGVQGNLGTISAADDYVDKLEKYDRKSMMANPNVRAEVMQATKNYLMFQKEAFKLGVLNKEDVPQLDAVVRNPNDINNILVAKDALVKLARFNQAFQRDRIVDAYQTNQKEIPSFVKGKLEKIDSEMEKASKPKEANNPVQIQNALKMAGQSYDPSKFEYRIIDGKVQARSK